MAAAIGAGLPVAEPTGNMIVDIGGGTTEVAVISLGGIVVSQSLRVGGDEMDEAIINHIKREYKLLIGQQTAEEIKLEVGSAFPMKEEVQAEVRGRDMLTGLPKTVILSSEEVRHALEEPVNQIIDAIKSTLDKTPPELAADIMDRGIVLAGGGALLQGLDERLRHETHMPMHLAESPLTCVAVGSGRSLEEFDAIHRSSRAPARATAARGIDRSRREVDRASRRARCIAHVRRGRATRCAPAAPGDRSHGNERSVSSSDPPTIAREDLLARAPVSVSGALARQLPVLVGRRSALVARGRRRRGGADDHAAVVQLCAGARPSRSATPGNRHGAARGSRRLGASTGHRVACSRTTPTRRGPRSRGAPGPSTTSATSTPRSGCATSTLPEPRLPGGWRLLTWIGAAPERARRVVRAGARRDRRCADARRHDDGADRRRVGARMEAIARLARRESRVTVAIDARRGCRLVHRPARLATAVAGLDDRRHRDDRRRAASGSPTRSSSSRSGGCATSADVEVVRT